MERSDLEKLVDKILNHPTWSKFWKYHSQKHIKTFWKWLKKTDESPPEVKWIRPTNVKIGSFPINELLNINEIKTLADSRKNPRDRALIYVLWEGGTRIGELLTLRLRDIEHNPEGDSCFLHLQKSKTELRPIPIYYFYRALSEWLKAHPLKDRPDSPLWCNFNGDKTGHYISYSAVCKMFKAAVKECGLTQKRFNIHSLRHSSISFFVQEGTLTQAEICQKYWGRPASQMLNRYVHMDKMKTLAKMRGVDVKEIKLPHPKICPKCGRINDSLSEYCECGLTQNYAFKTSQETFMRSVWHYINQNAMKDPNFMSRIMQEGTNP